MHKKYYKKLDALAKNSFAEFQKALSAYEGARAVCSRLAANPANTADDKIEKLKAEAKLLETKEGFARAKRNFETVSKEISEIRDELIAEISDSNRAKPEDVNAEMVELLKSGILRPDELRAMADSATPTMRRMITKYALNRSEELMKTSAGRDAAVKFRQIYSDYGHDDGDEAVKTFDSIVRVFDRCVSNPSMMNRWDDLLGDVIYGDE